MRLYFFAILLFYFKLLHSQGIKWIVYDSSNSKIPDNIVKFISADKQCNIWFSTGDCFTGGDLCMFDGKNFYTWKPETTVIKDRFITCITFTEDTSVMWIGTRNNGLFLKLKGEWQHFCVDNSKLKGNHVLSVYPEKDFTLVATNAGIVKIYQSNFYYFTKDNSKLPDNHVNHIAKDKNGKYWISTDKGLVITDLEKEWKIINKTNSLLKDDLVYSVSFDRNDNAWVSFWGGILKIDQEFKMVLFDENNSPLPPYSEYSISFDKYDNIWIASNFGVFKFQNDKWENYTPKNSNFPDFFSNKILYCRDKIWVATQKGLAVSNID